MLCGRWESYPREFAKCRRCRKAKYCGKECQSTAWSEGHRFWCSAKDGTADVDDASTVVNGGSSRGEPTPQTGTVRGDSGAATVQHTGRRGRGERPEPPAQTQQAPAIQGLFAMLARSRGTNPPNTAAPPANNMSLNRPVQQVRADPAMYAEYLRTAFGVGGRGDAAAEAVSAGRRRAETVTGATSPANARRDLVIPPYVPIQGQVSHHRVQVRRIEEVPPNAAVVERLGTEDPSIAFHRSVSDGRRRRGEGGNDMEVE